jgi:hypothetical protein
VIELSIVQLHLSAVDDFVILYVSRVLISELTKQLVETGDQVKHLQVENKRK